MKYIFLHGLGQIASDWSETVKDMEGDVLCPNLSEWVLGKEASYGNLYRALEECCEAQKESLHLCGLSLGGILALQYALEHPQKVASVVLIRPLQRYKALGNAIALPCADYIMAGIYEVLADRAGKEE